jgi:oligopeptide/dipeptide ABC transporter ATP-binding protein
MTAAPPPPLLSLRGLAIRFGASRTATVDGIDLDIAKGETVALVGESGSGKSLVAHTAAGILTPAAHLAAERFVFAGMDLAERDAPGWSDVRGREIGIIFQNPQAALNPMRRIGRQIADVIREHHGLRGGALREAVVAALAAVRIADPERRIHAYPGELSGGMCQRVMIAVALAGGPAVLIADEPTTGLDTTTQAAVLDLVMERAAERHMATLLITHDLAVARAYASRVVVMHAGQIVEQAAAADLFGRPRHPYSAGLIAASPATVATAAALCGVAGNLPDLNGPVPACRFAERCERVLPRCRVERPPLVLAGADHAAACWNAL